MVTTQFTSHTGVQLAWTNPAVSIAGPLKLLPWRSSPPRANTHLLPAGTLKNVMELLQKVQLLYRFPNISLSLPNLLQTGSSSDQTSQGPEPPAGSNSRSTEQKAPGRLALVYNQVLSWRSWPQAPDAQSAGSWRGEEEHIRAHSLPSPRQSSAKVTDFSAQKVLPFGSIWTCS